MCIIFHFHVCENWKQINFLPEIFSINRRCNILEFLGHFSEILFYLEQVESYLKLLHWDFPGGTVVKNPPANAGDSGSSPGLGRSHMPRSNRAREPQLLSLCIWSLCSATREAAIVRGPHTAMKSGPRLPQLEKALAQKRRHNTTINKVIN